MAGERMEERMVCFRLLVTGGDLEGFRALQPVGGATTFCFKLKCTRCGEVTCKDVCLRPADTQMILPHGGPCSYRVRRSSAGRYVRSRCYPTCYNPAHIVRKCKVCGSLGSVELVPTAAVALLATGGSQLITTVECIGYIPVSFSPGPHWTLTTMAGEEIETGLTGDTFMGQDDSGNNIIIKGVNFVIRDD